MHIYVTCFGKRPQRIKYDDKMIQAEGVESLSDTELRQACRERGILGLLSVPDMLQQLRDWLDLSLHHSLPSSLLIFSRAFTISGKLRLEEAVMNTMSSLPDEVVDTVGVTSLPSENDISERRRKLEFLEMQEELIKAEEEKVKSELVRLQESGISTEDLALKEMATPTVSQAQDIVREKTKEKKDQLCELSHALAVLASTSIVDIYNSMVEKEGAEGEEEVKKAYKAAREDSDDSSERPVDNKVSSALIDRVDTILQNLEKETDDVDAKIGDGWWLLDRDCDGKVTPEEVAAAAAYLKDTLDKEGIQELISSLSKDNVATEGKILVQDIVKLGTRTEEQDDNTEEAGRM
ncbi:hypothetical protein MKX01_002389 [Papaver californicum]|nr:hypothetical protein MKX01_002389 [Papaver californicum]